MDGFQVDPGQIREAAVAVGRNSGYLGDMADYCADLVPSKDGAEFGEIFAQYHKAYEDAAETQVEVLRDMMKKLGLTRDALAGTADEYDTNDSDAGDRFGEIEEAENSKPGGAAPESNPAEESEDGES